MWTYDEIVDKIHELQASYPDLISVTTAQEAYGLEKLDCNNGKFCETYILTVTNKQNNDPTKQQVFISGGVHGNERIGESTSIELIEMLLTNYEKNKWINYLLNHRIIVIVPMTNAQGYYLKEREEFRWVDPKTLKPDTNNEYSYADQTKKNGKVKLVMDPNRDFPYHLKDHRCLQTVTAQTVYKVFEEHPFTLGITFHAGETSITYPWGAGNHISGKPIRSYGFVDGKSTDAPDKKSFESIVKTLKDTAGAYSGMKMYNTGPISDVVYAVEGGMEDWAYAAGWENQENKKNGEEYQPVVYNCTTQYTEDKILDPETLQDRQKHYEQVRTDMVLIETSDEKSPQRQTLGVRNKNNNYDCVLFLLENPFYKRLSDAEVEKCQQMDGHIPRNMRVALNMIDLAGPYINVSHLEVQNDVVNMDWKMGGSVNVNQSTLYALPVSCKDKHKRISEILGDYLKEKNENQYEISSETLIKKRGDSEQLFNLIDKKFVKMKSNQGFGIWNFNDTNGIKQRYTNFFAKINLNKKCLALIVVAETDKDFQEQNKSRVDFGLPPQSYFTRQRIQKQFLYQFNHPGEQTSDYISYYHIFSDLYIVE